jgi:NADH:ubiquinone oxidoreductase subunit F (NADH-binding)/NADH:ubiquinone oxidoreductase subunit E
MSAATPHPDYRARLIPALQRIQREAGYLQRDKMVEAARELGVTVNKLQTVGSFFPLFRLTPPKKVTVSVCRDMACHLGGAKEIMARLRKLEGEHVEVKGMSCVGRCDRAPAACVALAGHEHESYYLARDAEGMAQIVQACVADQPPRPDLDIDIDFGAEQFEINPYRAAKDAPVETEEETSESSSGPEAAKPKKLRPFAGVYNVISIRDEALKAAAEKLQGLPGWSPARAEQFRRAALERMAPRACPDPEIGAKLKDWATNRGWAKGAERPKPGAGRKPAPAAGAARTPAAAPAASERAAAPAPTSTTAAPMPAQAAAPNQGGPGGPGGSPEMGLAAGASGQPAPAAPTSEAAHAQSVPQVRGDVPAEAAAPVAAPAPPPARERPPEDPGDNVTKLANWSDVVLEHYDIANLRGMGGAGQPSGGKLTDVRNAIRAARGRGGDTRGFIVVNGDESEPSTFKDRELLLRTPHLIVEGVIISGLLTDATQGFIYIRHEYPEQIEACRKSIKEAEALGLCGREATALGRPFPVEVFASPGGYVCGEQSALIEAMSDRRSEPRLTPPKLETNGLDNQPTIVSNVETYAWMPYICINGGKAYADLGMNGSKGRRIFSVCGDLERPGVYEVPIGMPLRDLIERPEYCGGIRGGRRMKAFAPSGPSGGFLPPLLVAPDGMQEEYKENRQWQKFAKARRIPVDVGQVELLDLWLELDLFRGVTPTAMLGAGLCVYDETRDMVDQAVNAIEFYRNESCGKCVPCRLGSQKLASLGTHLLNGEIDQRTWEEEIFPAVVDLHTTMTKTSICGLGVSVPNALGSVVPGFPEDFHAYLGNGARTR